jgi:hypothetical protein
MALVQQSAYDHDNKFFAPKFPCNQLAKILCRFRTDVREELQLKHQIRWSSNTVEGMARVVWALLNAAMQMICKQTRWIRHRDGFHLQVYTPHVMTLNFNVHEDNRVVRVTLFLPTAPLCHGCCSTLSRYARKSQKLYAWQTGPANLVSKQPGDSTIEIPRLAVSWDVGCVAGLTKVTSTKRLLWLLCADEARESRKTRDS